MAISCVDRISGLPVPILQHLLCFLSLKEAARTCVLSKSWRHHWCTRPIVEFREKSFKGKEETLFQSVVDKTLQRYLDQNLSIHEFRLQLSTFESKLASDEIIGKWIPKLKIFSICLLFEKEFTSYFKFGTPSTIFEAESLQKLYLEGSTLNQKCVVNVLCKQLKTLHLERVEIAGKAFEKIISGCPLIESLTIHFCCGLRTIKVQDKLCNLKHFEVTTSYGYAFDKLPSIEINIPCSVIERIIIFRCDHIWFRNDQRNLKSLSLTSVRLSSELFDFFSWNMPSLEFLELISCYGFEEFHLSSRSIKHFVFDNEYKLENCENEPLSGATIDAPNILSFKYSSPYLPAEFSFTTTNSSTHKWKSNVRLKIKNDSSWFLRLYQLLEDLSGSEISLFLHRKHPRKRKNSEDVILQDKPYNYKNPLAVEQLELWITDQYSKASRSDFVNQLFGICHPRVLVGVKNTDDFLSKLLGKKRHYLWQPDLEDVSVETYDQDRRFRLKWRET